METIEPVSGLHHVTAVASDPSDNVRFYTDVLGLRLVKRTVNFDDITTYHLYYGDETGLPGTIMTFFPFIGSRIGRVGRGQTSATAFVIPEGSVEFWLDRLDALGVDHDAPEERFSETVIGLRDHDGQPIELVTGVNDIEPWAGGPVPAEHAVRGFHGVSFLSTDPDATRAVLELLGYEAEREAGERTRFVGGSERASVIDLVDDPAAGPAVPGAGTIHHIAFRVPDDETQAAYRERAIEAGHYITHQKDRNYFRSVYFREPGGVLFELATDGPGFTADEPVEGLGEALKLPDWLEADRETIERSLPPIEVKAE
jgi:glyoxalase family protein